MNHSFPPSVALRLEAARIAAEITTSDPASMKAMCDTVHGFLTAGLGLTGENGLDAACQPPARDPVMERNNILLSPLTTLLTLRETTVELLERASINTVRKLAQASSTTLGNFELSRAEVDKVRNELATRGLHLSMDNRSLGCWVQTGSADASQGTHIGD